MIKGSRPEYIEACTETHKLTEATCQRKWEEFIADIEDNPNPAHTQRTIRSLSATKGADQQR